MKAAQRWHLSVGSELRVTGYNPEMADFDNPQGAQVDELFFVVAETERGDRRVYGTYASADLAAAAVPSAPPVSLWDEWYPVYGSEAYQDSDEESSYAEWERANDGPIYGLRSTPTPGYRGVI